MKPIFFRTLVILLVCSAGHLFAENSGKLNLMHPELVNRFYAQSHQNLFWFGTSFSDGMRSLLLKKLDSSAYIGTGRNKYAYDRLAELHEGVSAKASDSVTLRNHDMIFTDAAIAYCKDLYQGYGIKEWMKYDEWSAKYEKTDDDFILSHLQSIKTPDDLNHFINLLEPSGKEYAIYKEELKQLFANGNSRKAKQIAVSMNFYRWVLHFHFERFIVVNIGSATLRYYQSDKQVLFSRMIVGKPTTRTPRFAATSRQIILYPYWNVPRSIALKELLPKYKKSLARFDAENMQLVNDEGRVVDPYSVNWSQYNSNYFPYRLRQSTGCDNSLGIIKFDLTSPFGVYLHDTNTKGLFGSKNRYRSHGCMRVEKAIELGNLLLNNKLDTAFLQACIKGEKPIPVQLEKPVPVFVLYMLAEVNDNDTVSYYEDVYHLQAK